MWSWRADGRAGEEVVGKRLELVKNKQNWLGSLGRPEGWRVGPGGMGA